MKQIYSVGCLPFITTRINQQDMGIAIINSFLIVLAYLAVVMLWHQPSTNMADAEKSSPHEFIEMTPNDQNYHRNQNQAPNNHQTQSYDYNQAYYLQPDYNQQQAYNPQQVYNSQQAYNPQQDYNQSYNYPQNSGFNTYH